MALTARACACIRAAGVKVRTAGNRLPNCAACGAYGAKAAAAAHGPARYCGRILHTKKVINKHTSSAGFNLRRRYYNKHPDSRPPNGAAALGLFQLLSGCWHFGGQKVSGRWKPLQRRCIAPISSTGPQQAPGGTVQLRPSPVATWQSFLGAKKCILAAF